MKGHPISINIQTQPIKIQSIEWKLLLMWLLKQASLHIQVRWSTESWCGFFFFFYNISYIQVENVWLIFSSQQSKLNIINIFYHPSWLFSSVGSIMAWIVIIKIFYCNYPFFSRCLTLGEANGITTLFSLLRFFQLLIIQKWHWMNFSVVSSANLSLRLCLTFGKFF